MVLIRGKFYCVGIGNTDSNIYLIIRERDSSVFDKPNTELLLLHKCEKRYDEQTDCIGINFHNPFRETEFCF